MRGFVNDLNDHSGSAPPLRSRFDRRDREARRLNARWRSFRLGRRAFPCDPGDIRGARRGRQLRILFAAKQVATSGEDPGKNIFRRLIYRDGGTAGAALLVRRRKQRKKNLSRRRRGEITSKSLENLSGHFLNSAFARLAYYFYGSPGWKGRARFLRRCNAARSISNMLINDPFER